MGINRNYPSLFERTPLFQLLISMLIILGVGIVLFTVFLLAGILIFNVDSGLLENLSSAVGEKDISFLKYIFISQDISFFIVPAIIILIKLNPGHQQGLMGIKMPRINEIVLIIVLGFCIFPITSFTGQLNSGMNLPDWLSGVEEWMTEKEDNANRLIDMCMTSNTFWGMIMNVLVIAVIPAIGEELIFRGVIQKVLSNLFKSGHLAIWITAFVFSAIHLQFYGFVPRFILGLIFGYLFFWSGTLWLPVISHFVNNAVPTIGAYIQGLGSFNIPLDIPLWKQAIGLPLPIIISIMILLYFRNKSKKVAESGMNQYPSSNK
jgi:membrane protease YdiL (CAAX protease family)